MGNHEKVFGFCDAKCKVEVLSKADIEEIFEEKDEIFDAGMSTLSRRLTDVEKWKYRGFASFNYTATSENDKINSITQVCEKFINSSFSLGAVLKDGVIYLYLKEVAGQVYYPVLFNSDSDYIFSGPFDSYESKTMTQKELGIGGSSGKVSVVAVKFYKHWAQTGGYITPNVKIDVWSTGNYSRSI